MSMEVKYLLKAILLESEGARSAGTDLVLCDTSLYDITLCDKGTPI